MWKNFRSQKGFTLIEVVAAAALIGILATMLMPSLSGANNKVKNAKLSNDLAAIDQAIQLYRMDHGTVPANLEALDSEYLGGKLEFKDAVGAKLDYTPNENDNTYTLSGQDASKSKITSDGSKSVSAS